MKKTLKILPLLFIGFLLSGCGSNSTEPVDPYDFYSTFLGMRSGDSQEILLYDNTGSHVTYDDQLASFLHEQLLFAPDDLCDAFVEENSEPMILEDRFSNQDFEVTLIGAEQLSAINHDGDEQDLYFSEHPAAGKVVRTVSKPVFSADGNMAIIYYGFSDFEHRGGNGEIFFLVKIFGKWTIISEYLDWMS